MARQRRGGGFKPPELRGTLGTLLRTTLAQVGPLRDALERGAREGRSRLDEALSGRRRHDALAELGEIVLDLIRRGEIDLGELPEVRDVVAHLDELDSGAAHHEDEHDESSPPLPARKRFDARGRDRGDDDGTVSSMGKTWAPPNRKRPEAKVWRPPVEDTPPASPRPRPPKKGGISFEEDEDLAEYMHPDDVPPKGSSDGDS
jgi:hypothetical protein